MRLNIRESDNTVFLATILLCTIFMGSSFPSGKYIISNVLMPPFYSGGWRFLTAGLLMLAIHGIRNGFESIIPSSKKSIARGFLFVFVVGCLQTAGTMGFLNLALRTLSSSMSSIILFTNPLWLAILAHFYLGEHLSKKKILALMLGVTGVSICLGMKGGDSLEGLLFALTGSLCWSFCTLISKKNTFDKSTFVFTGWQLLFGALVMLGVSSALGEHYDMTQINTWGVVWFVWLIVPASIGSFSLWFSALNSKGATVTSCYLFLVPLFSTAFSILFLHERLSYQFIVGGSIIIFALWLINSRGRELAPAGIH